MFVELLYVNVSHIFFMFLWRYSILYLFWEILSSISGKSRQHLVLFFLWNIGMGPKIQPIDFGINRFCVLITVIKNLFLGQVKSWVVFSLGMISPDNNFSVLQNRQHCYKYVTFLIVGCIFFSMPK